MPRISRTVDILGSVNTSSDTAAKVRALLGEVVRFLAVGGLATLVSFVGFNALVHGLFGSFAPLRSQPIVGYVVANVAAGFVAYVGMRLWTYRHRDARDPASGLVRFFGLGALTMAIPVVCLWASRRLLGLDSALADNVSANVVGLGLGAAARFWVFREYVFDQVAVAEPCPPTA
jgi:putative flippase GtrA